MNEKDISLPLTLLEGLSASDCDDKLLYRLYRSIRVRSDTSQTTWPGRWREVDEVLVEEIDKAFPASETVRVHDMAVSSGITSLELFDHLTHVRVNVYLHASEYFDRLYFVSPPKSHWQIIFNNALAPVQFVGRGTAISAQQVEKNLIKRFIRRWVMATSLPRAFEILGATLLGTGGEAETARQRVRTVSLFDPRCRARAAEDSRFTIGHDDLFACAFGPSHVVRVMNGLRLHSVAAALPAMHRSLIEGGLLALGEGKRNTTIFRRTTAGFAPIRDVGEGTHLRALVALFSAHLKPALKEMGTSVAGGAV